MSTTGSRYSGNRSTYSYARDSLLGWSPRSRSCSYNSTQAAAGWVEAKPQNTLPPYSDWVNGRPPPVRTYRSNRSDRERFATRALRRVTGLGNFNMHSNRPHDATIKYSADSPPPPPGSPEVNTNNSRHEENKRSQNVTSDSGGSGMISDAPNASNEEKSTGTAVPSHNNNNNNNNNNSHLSSGLMYDQGARLSRSRSGLARRSTAALKAVSCSALEVDAFLHQLDSERLHPDVELLSCVLDEYRNVLGLGDHDAGRSVKAWPAAWRLAQLPAGQWVVGEVIKHAKASLSNILAVKPSEYCRDRRMSALGLSLLGGVDDSLKTRLVGSVSAELENVVLQRAVVSVARTFASMTSLHHRHHQQQQSVRQRFSQHI